MEEYINVIGNLGFPIALVIYFLARFEKKIGELSKTLELLAKQIDNIQLRDQISKEFREHSDHSS